MGFTGDFVIARSRLPLLDLALFADDGAACDEGDGIDCFQSCGTRDGFWQTLQIHHGLDRDREWLQSLVDETDAPVMIASVHDSDLCEVRGLAPQGDVWSAVLDPQTRVAYGAQAPAGADPVPAESDAMLGWYRAQIPAVVHATVQWSVAAGLAADEKRLAEVLAKRADPFVEGLYFEFLEAAGLPALLPEQDEQDADRDDLVHPRHKAADRWLGGKLERAVLNMSRDSHVVVTCLTDVNYYAQVWLRRDDTYQLEYRDRSPSEHYQTRTVSREKVIAALTSWTAGETAWRDQFQWTNLVGWTGSC